MRTGNMENTRSQPKKNKINFKPKPKSNNDEIENSETQLSSPVERIKVNHLATTPITPAGNIVDMQGSLDQVTPDKLDNDKSDKNCAKSEPNKENSSADRCEKEQQLTIEGDGLKSENASIPDVDEESKSFSKENKSAVEKNETNSRDTSEKSKLVENQGNVKIMTFHS